MAVRRKTAVFAWIVLIVLLIAVLLVGGYWVLRLGFDTDVFDRSGWKSTDTGTQYWNYDGEPLTGWQEIDGTTFYFGPDGNLATGWQEIDGSRYYLGVSGVPYMGWQTVDGQRCFFDEQGKLATGWQTIEEARYYFGEDGVVRTDQFCIDEHRYLSDSSGALLTGWQQTSAGLLYLGSDGILRTGWQEIDGKRYYLDPETGAASLGITVLDGSVYYFDPQGALSTGWQEIGGKTYYFYDDGTMALGWTDLGEHRFYFTQDQGMALGWQELDGKTYYFKDNGVMAIGQITLDGVNHFFTSQGVYVLLVNQWNPVPEDYEADLVEYKDRLVDASARDALAEMVAAGRAAGHPCSITSVYRSEAEQQFIWTRRKNAYMAEGYDAGMASYLTGRSVAIPGHSEHHTGLAVDFNRQEAGTLSWMGKHCWEYGFILRYPAGKTDYTGIIYEVWHFRYVGVELAQELKELGLCLEEYMQMLTAQEAAKAPPQ